MEHVNKMRDVERVIHLLFRARIGKEPIKVRWVDTLKSSGLQRSRLVGKEFRRGSTVVGFTNFSATPPLELVKLIVLLVATAQQDRAARLGRGTRVQCMNRDDTHTIAERIFTLWGNKMNTLNCRLRREEVELLSVDG